MRMSAVQTDEQLVYVVRCLVAYADACGLFTSKPELQEVFRFFIYMIVAQNETLNRIRNCFYSSGYSTS